MYAIAINISKPLQKYEDLKPSSNTLNKYNTEHSLNEKQCKSLQKNDSFGNFRG
jgi:hypothetical protein